MSLELALDCRHYLGDRPCRFKARCRCANFAPIGHRILIIKLGALGDVIRTACLLPTLKELYPQSRITWVSRPNGVRMLTRHPLIDQLLAFDAEGLMAVSGQDYDLVLSLDKEPGPTALCNAVKSPDKRGMEMSPWGTAQPCGAMTESYFELGLDDDLKFRGNRRTYPELVHEAVGLPYTRQRYRLYCDEAAQEWAKAMFTAWNVIRARADVARQSQSEGPSWPPPAPRPFVGLQTGAGTVFANKAPAAPQWIKVSRLLIERGYNVVLLGGPEEVETNRRILEEVGHGVFASGCDNPERQFMAIVDQCHIVVTGDTLALHVALGRGVPVVALFGPTCEQEIDLFDLGEKIVTPFDCAPCYRRRCPKQPSCMDAIPAEEIVAKVEAVWRKFEGRVKME